MRGFLITLRAMRRRTILLALATAILTPIGIARGSDLPESPGRELFVRKWPTKEQHAVQGDGLGPMYNARSCVGCHDRGGVGGAGLNEHNVDLLTAIDIGRSNSSAGRKLLQQIHPAFANSSTITIHRFGTEAEYNPYRSNLLALREDPLLRLPTEPGTREVSVRRTQVAGRDVIKIGQVVLRRSQRNTPSLFGAGDIDQIDVEDLTENMRSQPTALRGRVAGRFGWQGQIADLEAFVVGACANELGLQTPGNDQAPDPTQPRYRNSSADMTSDEVLALFDFVARLEPPSQYQPTNKQEEAAIRRGSVLFVDAQCAACHTANLGNVKGLYSDLLTHDMGGSLADPTGLINESSSGGWSSGRQSRGLSRADLARRWRTPPLWGVRDSGPYLHDGRASTLELAIDMHDGQGKQAAKKFAGLERTQREDLLAFVKSLGTP